MPIRSLFSILSGIIFLAGFFPYIRAVLRGRAKPSKSSWIIWASLDTVALAGMCVSHTLNGQILAATCGSWMVVILALKHGIPGWSKLDKTCLVGALLGILLWIIFANPVLAILASMSVVFLGSMPTFRSVWEDPDRENLAAWVCYWISCIFSFLAIPRWTLAAAAQPMVFFAMDTIVLALLLRPKKQLRGKRLTQEAPAPSWRPPIPKIPTQH